MAYEFTGVATGESVVRDIAAQYRKYITAKTAKELSAWLKDLGRKPKVYEIEDWLMDKIDSFI